MEDRLERGEICLQTMVLSPSFPLSCPLFPQGRNLTLSMTFFQVFLSLLSPLPLYRFLTYSFPLFTSLFSFTLIIAVLLENSTRERLKKKSGLHFIIILLECNYFIMLCQFLLCTEKVLANIYDRLNEPMTSFISVLCCFPHHSLCAETLHIQ